MLPLLINPPTLARSIPYLPLFNSYQYFFKNLKKQNTNSYVHTLINFYLLLTTVSLLYCFPYLSPSFLKYYNHQIILI